MTRGLIVLSGAIPGLRDLVWDEDPQAALGYMPYRAENRYGPWTPLSVAPVPGERFRDATTLESVTLTVLPEHWTDRGLYEYWAFKIPNAPIYGEIVSGRALLASTPEHVTLTIDGRPVPAARVDGADGMIWMFRGHTLQGQADPVTRSYGDLTDDSVVTVTYRRLTNFVDITPEARAYYTVVPILADGSPAYLPGAAGDVVNIMEVDKMDFMQAEMVRRNAWEFEMSAEPAHLLIRRTKGTPCACATSSGGPRTGCSSCFETGIVGGYYGPYDIPFIDPDTAATTEINEGGRKVTRQSRSYLGPSPVIHSGDLIVRKNGERLVISSPTHKSPRGVLLQQDFDVSLLPPGDVRYRIPLWANNPVPPVYDSRFQDPNGLHAEPLVSPTTDPTKIWENREVVPEGRTRVFGNIQT